MGGGKGMSVLRRVTGLGSAGSLALALLAGGGVLAATAGPRQAQATGARALQQTMDAVPPLDRTIVVGSSWARVTDAMGSATGNTADQNLTQADVDDVTTQLRRDFSTGPLRLTPPSTDWMGMNPGLYLVATPLPSLGGIPAKLEVAYRYPVAGHLRLVAGQMPATAPPPTSTGSQEIYHLQVVVTPQTASRFALRPGSQLTIGGPLNVAIPGKLTVIRLDVTGIVAPADPGSSFWNADPLLPAPALDRVGGGESWEGAVIADPGEIDMVQQIFGPQFLLVQWELPVDTTGLHGQAQALYNQVNQLTNRTPALTGPLAPMANALGTSSGLVQPLAAFVQASNDVNVLLWIVYAGLAVAGVVTLLLAARMIAARRSAELTVRRARGASLAQLFSLGTRGAAVACVPAAALAWVIAVLLVRGADPASPGPGRLVAGPRDARLRRDGPRAGGGLAAPPAPPPGRAAALALAAQSRLRGHRLRRGHRRHRGLPDAAGRDRAVRERGPGARRGASGDRGPAAVPGAAARAGAGLGPATRRHRVPGPDPGGAGPGHARAAGHDARPRAHPGRVHRHGPDRRGAR